MILAGIATYFNSRASVARQSVEAAANPQTAMMNKLALYVFPLGVVVGGPFLPLAIIFYWFANNIWTFGQQHYVFTKIEREDEEKKREAIERRAANAPAPGAKPKRSAAKTAASGNGAGDAPVAETPKPDTDTGNRAPRPGAKPKKRGR
jgi:YidC/Oxa1 family membrane protein insertase